MRLERERGKVMNRQLLGRLCTIVFLVVIICICCGLLYPVFGDEWPPEGYIQVVQNGGFEEGSEPWYLIGDARIEMWGHDSDYMLAMGGTDVLSLAMQEIDLVEARCSGDNDVLVKLDFSWIVPPPLTDPGTDVFEGWLAVDGVTFVDLWERYEEEFEYNSGWNTVTYRVLGDGFWDAVGIEGMVEIWLGASTNETPSSIYVDNVELWCEKAWVAPWEVYLPFVSNGG